MSGQSHFSFKIGLLLFICSANVDSLNMKDASKQLKDSCQKMDKVPLPDQKYKFNISDCELSGNVSNSFLKGFSQCDIESLKNTSSEITATIRYPAILWIANGTLHYVGCKFVKDHTIVKIWFNDIWSCADVNVTIKLQQNGDDNYDISQVTVNFTLQDGMTRIHPVNRSDPDQFAAAAQAENLINEGDNYLNEQFKPFQKTLSTMLGESYKKALSQN